MIGVGTCAICHTSGEGTYYFRSKIELLRAGMLKPEDFPGRNNNPIEVHFNDGDKWHELKGLTAMCTIDQLTRALFEALGNASGSKFHYGTYYNGYVVRLNKRAIKADSDSSAFAFTGAEIKSAEDPQALSPPIILLEAVGITSEDCPRRNTTKPPELSPEDAICCWTCSHRLNWHRSIWRRSMASHP